MTKVKAHSKTCTAANILTVTVGSNCPQGGDCGHGGRTFLRIHDDAATAWQVRVDQKIIDQPTEIEIILGGDHEADTFVEALEFAAKMLRGRIGTGFLHDSHDENVTF